jgi:hypothetical protein
VGRVNKHDRFSPVELIEKGIEQWVSQVSIANARKKADAVET